MKTILIIDSDSNLINSLTLYLEEAGFKVEKSTDFQEGGEILLKTKIDLIIWNVLLPGIEEFKFLNKIRSNKNYYFLPVIAITTRGLTQDRISGYKLGCDFYLSKPFNIEELILIIKNLLNRSTYFITEKIYYKQKKEKKDLLLSILCKRNKIDRNLLKKNYLQDKKKYIKNQFRFTPREQSVLKGVVQGLRNKQIASNLNISIRIVEKYVSKLLSKTNTQNRTELVKCALENSLINEK